MYLSYCKTINPSEGTINNKLVQSVVEKSRGLYLTKWFKHFMLNYKETSWLHTSPWKVFFTRKHSLLIDKCGQSDII